MSQHGWKVWKDIAYPGAVHVPFKGGLLRYDFTRRDMDSIARNGRSQVREGWHVPICWEHQDVEPERVQLSQNPERDFARGVFAHIEDFAVGADGRAKALLSGSDPKDLEQLKKVKFVSPEIQWDWVDTDGKLWRGPSVTHLAATPRPVQRHQNPIGSDPDAQSNGISRAETLPDLIRMSLGGANRVAPKIRLSLENWFPGGHGGATPMADENSTYEGGEGNKKMTPWERAAKALEMCGIKIGDGKNIKDADHFADLIEVACMNSEASQPADEEPEEPDEENEEGAPEGDMNAPPEGSTEPPPPPVQMSLEAQAQLNAAHAKLLDNARKDLLRRVAVLGKRFVPVVVNGLDEEVKKARLSLGANLTLNAHPVITKIETLEKLPKESTWQANGRQGANPANGAAKPAGKGKKARLSQRANAAPIVASPYAANAEESESVAEDVADQFFAAAGTKPRADAN